jgi:hypothetical protein
MSKIKSSRQRRKEASRRNYLSKHGKTWESQFSLSPSAPSSKNGPWRSVSSERAKSSNSKSSNSKSSNSKTRKSGRGRSRSRGRK